VAEIVVLRLGVLDVSYFCGGRGAPLDGVEELAKGLENLVRFDEDQGVVLLTLNDGVCISTSSSV